jgi:hypothetical protein
MENGNIAGTIRHLLECPKAEPISLCPCNKYDIAPQKVVILYARMTTHGVKKRARSFSGYVIGSPKKSFSGYVSGTRERREARGELGE